MEDGAKQSMFIDGELQENLSNIQVAVNSGDNRLDTIERGLAGFSHGSGDVTITGTAVVLVGGMEFDYHNAVVNRSYYTVQVTVGPTTYMGNGRFMDASYGMSVGASTEVNFTWVGELNILE